jgi:urease accessory protein
MTSLKPPEIAMQQISHVIGSRIDPNLSEKLHDLEHRGAIDTVVIPSADLSRRRLRAITRGGIELAIALPRDEKLYDGAVLTLSDDHAVVVRAATERWLRLEPASTAAAVELGYHAGNLHWRVRFDGACLLVALEGRPEDYAARIEPMIASKCVRVSIVDDNEADVHDHSHGGHHHHHHHDDSHSHHSDMDG